MKYVFALVLALAASAASAGQYCTTDCQHNAGDGPGGQTCTTICQ